MIKRMDIATARTCGAKRPIPPIAQLELSQNRCATPTGLPGRRTIAAAIAIERPNLMTQARSPKQRKTIATLQHSDHYFGHNPVVPNVISLIALLIGVIFNVT